MSPRMRPPTLAAGVLAVAALLAACGGTTPTTDASGSGSADTLRMAFLGSVATPDPDTAYDGSELNLVDSAYEGLLDYAPGQADPEIVGRLATDWTASDDNTVFTFTLRQGVTFHDGTPFTADAVEASFARRTEAASGPAYMVAGVKDVTTDGDYQVTVTLDAPDDSFLDLLASPFGPKMVSPTAIAEHPWDGEDDDWFATDDAGTGPYEYGDFELGVSYELTAYDGYWGDAPGYPTVHFDVVSSMSTIQMQLEAGEIDGVVGYDDASSLAAAEAMDGVTTYTFPSMLTPVLFVNPDSATLGDADTRLSLLSGIDFDALATSALGDTAATTTEVFPVNLLSADLNQQQVAHDDGALAELAAGALADGTISCGYAEASPAAGSLCDTFTTTLTAAGIDATSTGYGSGTYYSGLEGDDAPDVTFYTGFPDTAHPDAWATVFYTPDGGLDLFGADVDGVSDLLAEAKATGDEDLYGQVAKKISASGYWYSVASALGTADFADDVTGVDTAWNPVITGVLQLQLLSPAGA